MKEDRPGCTVLDLAGEKGHIEVAALLREAFYGIES